MLISHIGCSSWRGKQIQKYNNIDKPRNVQESDDRLRRENGGNAESFCQTSFYISQQP